MAEREDPERQTETDLRQGVRESSTTAVVQAFQIAQQLLRQREAGESEPLPVGDTQSRGSSTGR
jgi:hypothetical protein